MLHSQTVQPTIFIPVPQGGPTMRDDDDPIRYTIDKDTIELLEAVLNNSERLADAQWEDDSADEIRLLNRELGDRFGLEYTDLTIIEGEDGDGNLQLTIKEHAEANNGNGFRPKLVVDNSDGFVIHNKENNDNLDPSMD